MHTGTSTSVETDGQPTGWNQASTTFVGGNLNDGVDDSKLTAEEEDEHQAAFSFGASVDAKMRSVLETATRFNFWTRTQLTILRGRRCVAIDPDILDRAVGRLRGMFSNIMRIEPDDAVRVLFTIMVYQNAMAVCTREFYLQCNPLQSRKMNSITIMNRSLSSDHIKWMQSTFNGKRMTELVSDLDHPYADLVDLCIFGSQFEICTKVSWLRTYCAFGCTLQDAVPRMFQDRLDGRRRRPLVVLLVGQWCVLDGIDTVFLCRRAAEAVMLWVLLLWVRYDSCLEDHLDVHSFLQNCLETPDVRRRQAAVSVIAGVQSRSVGEYMTDNAKQRWADRLGGSSVVWSSLDTTACTPSV